MQNSQAVIDICDRLAGRPRGNTLSPKNFLGRMETDIVEEKAGTNCIAICAIDNRLYKHGDMCRSAAMGHV